MCQVLAAFNSVSASSRSSNPSLQSIRWPHTWKAMKIHQRRKSSSKQTLIKIPQSHYGEDRQKIQELMNVPHAVYLGTSHATCGWSLFPSLYTVSSYDSGTVDWLAYSHWYQWAFADFPILGYYCNKIHFSFRACVPICKCLRLLTRPSSPEMASRNGTRLVGGSTATLKLWQFYWNQSDILYLY